MYQKITETGQRQDFNDYELVQDEYLQRIEMTDNLETIYARQVNQCRELE